MGEDGAKEIKIFGFKDDLRSELRDSGKGVAFYHLNQLF